MYVERHYTLLFSAYFFKKGKNEKDHNFWEKPWTNPFEKRQILPLPLIDVFLWSRKPISLYRTAPKIIIWNIFAKKKEWENLKFLTKTMDSPL